MISPGSDYGEPMDPPADALEVLSDHEAAHHLSEARSRGLDPPVLILRGGDLFRTLGGRRTHVGDPGPRQMVRVPVDLGVVVCDGEEHLFTAHAIFRNRRWQGRFEVVMNAQFLGAYDLGPRSHPGDGLLDITVGSLGVRQRAAVRNRARSGSHLPHPGLRTSRSGSHEVDTGHRTSMYLDGVRVAVCSSASIRLESEAFMVHI
jgi:hypothetical protein